MHISLGGVLFDHDSHLLTPQALAVLDKIAPVLNQYPSYEIVVEGHTDDTGTSTYNQKLSLLRAKRVAKHLKQDGNLNHDKLYIYGLGESQPLVKNDSKANRQKNRRVEIVLKQSGQ